jgi:hypothetical protein
MGIGGRAMAKRAEATPEFWAALSSISHPPFVISGRALFFWSIPVPVLGGEVLRPFRTQTAVSSADP